MKRIIAALLALAVLQWLSGNVAFANQVKLKAELGQSVLEVGKSGHIYLRIDLEGIAFDREEERSPVNVALVLDRSGSMRGPKLAQAKEAAIMALNRLGASDYISVVAYDHKVDVPVPSMRAANRARIEDRISSLYAGGRTALYAGTRQGIREVRKNLDEDRVNRVILLSDGLANVGPRTPRELGKLGQWAADKGISVTTIGLGLGYNEDLMSKLAYNSDGNHAFVERPGDLVKIFNSEFGDVLSVVAQDVIIDIDISVGFKPVRVLGRTADIKGNRVKLRLNQLYGSQKKYVVIELDRKSAGSEGRSPLADIDVSYRSMKSQKRERVSARPMISYSSKKSVVRASVNKAVMADVTTQVATEANEEAVSLRDAGKVEDARRLLEKNAAYLRQKADEYSSEALLDLERKNRAAAKSLTGRDWKKARKVMRAQQYKSKNQQAY